MLGKQTFGLTKKDFDEKISRIVNNHRVNSRIIGEPKEFILRSCRLNPTWAKISSDPEAEVYLRNIDIAGGRKVKMISLEKGFSKQPVSKAKILDFLYPPRKIKTSATPEERHFNSVKAAMRGGIVDQLKEYRESISLPTTCYISGKELRRGNRMDVDHVGTSFAEISDSFIADRGMVYTDIILMGPPTAKRFKDSSLWKDWQEYHRNKAILSLVCSSANRSKGAGDYETPQHLYGSFESKSPEEIDLNF